MNLLKKSKILPKIKSKREIKITNNGSSTFYMPQLGESYHSTKGAIEETYHVFIKNGLDYFAFQKEISILEMGYGTGLNAFVSFLESRKKNHLIYYLALEKYPLLEEEHKKLNYLEKLKAKAYKKEYENLFFSPWNEKICLSSNFYLEKKHCDIASFFTKKKFDLVYFDAFSPKVQPDLWTETIFEKLYGWMKRKSLLVTYCSKTQVRKTLEKVGFEVIKRPGPLGGKREIIQAWKN